MWLAPPLLLAALYLGLLFPDWRILPWLAPAARDPARERQRKLGTVIALAAGVAAAFPGALLVRGLAARLGIDPKAQITGDWSFIAAALLVFAPAEEATKVLAVWPLRSRFVKSAVDGLLVGSAAATGFACVEVALFLRSPPLHGEPFWLLVTRGMLAAVARVFAGALWGYAIGRARQLGHRWDRTIPLAWLAATALRGLFDHLIFGRGLAAVLGALPLFAGIVVVSYLAASELSPKSLPVARVSFLPSLPPPPSLRAMRDALRRAERPVMLRWIALGTLVTMGVIITCVVGAVAVGMRIGVDFGTVDEGQVTGIAPLALMGVGVLLAFPTAGYLVARASGADSVLESALSTGLAIVGTLVMLGLAAPVAVVFALAFAPIAFALACAGAWVGIGGARG